MISNTGPQKAGIHTSVPVVHIVHDRSATPMGKVTAQTLIRVNKSFRDVFQYLPFTGTNHNLMLFNDTSETWSARGWEIRDSITSKEEINRASAAEESRKRSRSITPST